jgi:hypothetical protein
MNHFIEIETCIVSERLGTVSAFVFIDHIFVDDDVIEIIERYNSNRRYAFTTSITISIGSMANLFL